MRVRNLLMLCVGAAALLGVAPAMADASLQTEASFWNCPRAYSGQTLNVYNWTTYIAEDTISNFERLCGVTVVYDTYASDTDMLDIIRQGNSSGYDVVVPSNATVESMIAEHLLQPLDHGSIPNIANLGTRFANPVYDPGNVYTVAYQWGTIGIGYNRTALGGDISSWNDVFNSTARVAWLDEYRAMFGFALLMLGDDPNTSDPTQIQAATNYLVTHGGNVRAIAPDTGQDLLAAHDVDIVIEYSGDIFQLIASCDCDDFRYVIPQEGAQIWSDNLAIPIGAKNKALAEVFIDYILDAQVGADISNYTAYASPNQRSIDEGLINSEYLNNPSIYLSDSLIGKLFYTTSNATLEELYSAAWLNVTAAVAPAAAP